MYSKMTCNTLMEYANAPTTLKGAEKYIYMMDLLWSRIWSAMKIGMLDIIHHMMGAVME